MYVCVVVEQGMFGIGKSTAKLINKETNIQSKFRYSVVYSFDAD